METVVWGMIATFVVGMAGALPLAYIFAHRDLKRRFEEALNEHGLTFDGKELADPCSKGFHEWGDWVQGVKNLWQDGKIYGHQSIQRRQCERCRLVEDREI